MNSIHILSLVAVVGAVQDADPDSALARQVREQLAPWSSVDSPGGVVCVLRGDEPVLLEAFGMADLEADAPITSETPFYLASTAKTITALCAVHAASEGTLDLDAPLREVFPELPESVADATLRQAMHHTSGLVDVYDAAIAADLPPAALASNAGALELLARIPAPNFPAGSRFLYSNSGYVLLAEALRRATGHDLAAYARAHVFEPLGMEPA